MMSLGSVVIQPIRHTPVAMKYLDGRLLVLEFDR